MKESVAGGNVNEQQLPLPKYKQNAFVCPRCNIHAQQEWHPYLYEVETELSGAPFRGVADHSELDISRCVHCGKISFWVEKNLVYPRTPTAPIAHKDMPKKVVGFYNEARQISIDSPAAAAAFLRVVAAEICRHHDEKDEEVQDLNEAIGNLSRNGLPSEAIQSLDLVRLLGNKGAHKGRIDLTGKDDKDVVDRLFKFINFIVEKTIAEPMEIKEFTESLSEGQRRQIRERDKKDNNE